MTADVMRSLAHRQKRPPLTSAERLSLEAAVYEAAVEVDDNVNELAVLAKSINDDSVQVDKTQCLIAGLDEVIARTLDEYSTSGLSQESSDMLRISVESVLRAAGVNVPLSEMIPSFEDASISVGSGTKGGVGEMMRRLGEMIAAIYNRIRENIGLFIQRMKSNKEATRAYIGSVKAKLNRAQRDMPSEPEVTASGFADLLTDRSDRIGKPADLIVANVALYEDFIVEWENKWKAIFNTQIPTTYRDSQAVTEFVTKVRDVAVAQARGTVDADMRFILSHHLEVTKGTGEFPVLGSKAVITQSAKAKSDRADVLTRAEMRDGLSTAEAALKVLDDAEKKMNLLTDNARRVGQATRTIKIADGTVSDVGHLREVLRAIGKAADLATWGYVNTVPVFLRSLKASVRYIDISASLYL